MTHIDKHWRNGQKEIMIQIIGTLSSKETQKAIRYMKERRKEFQFVDLKAIKLSLREWESIFQCCDEDEMIDTESQYYVKNGYKYRDFDPKQEVMEHIELLKLPVLRNKSKASLGFDKEFLEANS